MDIVVFVVAIQWQWRRRRPFLLRLSTHLVRAVLLGRQLLPQHLDLLVEGVDRRLLVHVAARPLAVRAQHMVLVLPRKVLVLAIKRVVFGCRHVGLLAHFGEVRSQLWWRW